MQRLNSVLIYRNVSECYYTDGQHVYYAHTKEQNAVHYRIRYKGKSYRIDETNYLTINQLTERNYLYQSHQLFTKLKWFTDKDGYYILTVDSKKAPQKISQHRLVYFYNNNIIPRDNQVIDHINQNKRDNRLENLRLVDFKTNANNVDKQKKAMHHSKYLYDCKDIVNNVLVLTGLAGDISREIGIDRCNVNRYAKKGYIYNKKYLITIAQNRKE